MLLTVSILLGIFGYGFLFIRFSPEFGGRFNKTLQKDYARSPQWNGKQFLNLEETTMDVNLGNIPKLLYKQFKREPNRRPSKDIVPQKLECVEEAGQPRFTWFGHSAFFIEWKKLKVLIDPMLGDVPAPHPSLGKKRFNSNSPMSPEVMPEIDLLILSHDHYDHLDYKTFKALQAKTKHYVVPLGVDRHLLMWGVDVANITVLDWWDDVEYEGVNLTLTPSRHFSGRGLGDRSTTLWGGYVLKLGETKVYFSGDGGYGSHFKDVGRRLGPFDLGLMECGQYNKEWEQIHCFPEQAVRAALDAGVKVAMPVHWGAFTLAFHPWTEPVERFCRNANKENLQVCTPEIGQPVWMDNTFPTNRWWEEYI